MGERLLQIFNKLNEVIKEYSPDVIAVESPFVKDNPKTAIAIGKAQAVVLLVAAQNGLECYEYPPRLIKQIVSNYGDADKSQMQKVVKMLLNLDEIPEPNDAGEYSGQFKLRIPKSLHKSLAEHSKAEGISMNQYCLYLLTKNDTEHQKLRA